MGERHSAEDGTMVMAYVPPKECSNHRYGEAWRISGKPTWSGRVVSDPRRADVAGADQPRACFLKPHKVPVSWGKQEMTESLMAEVEERAGRFTSQTLPTSSQVHIARPSDTSRNRVDYQIYRTFEMKCIVLGTWLVTWRRVGEESLPRRTQCMVVRRPGRR